MNVFIPNRRLRAVTSPVIMRVFLGTLAGNAFFCSLPAAAWVTQPENDAALLSQQQALPNLGSASVNESGTEKKLATLARQMAEVNQDENTDQTWRSYLLGEAKDRVLDRLQQKSEALLSPLGYTTVTLDVDERGRFNGSSGQLLLPLVDQKTRGLTYSQLGLQGVDDGVVGNMGLRQRWNAGRWLLGYNVFYDQYLNQDASRRGSIGAEARSDYLTLSSNYYYPLSGMHAANDDEDELLRMARLRYHHPRISAVLSPAGRVGKIRALFRPAGRSFR
ncbi:putative invasin [Sodalis glossinidius str. 'morsitans']|uniref:Invasin n=2 Tax=Sodalis glossinidius (strain morsitans) TaxID=343509 RepID=Q2NRT1_SODGM|nr:putative invasin [Sodalis glossinidius str. 'morsitans']